MATAWYYAHNGEQKGPVTTEELKALVTSQFLLLDDLIWKKGLAEWVKVGKVRELATLAQAASQKAVKPSPQPQTSAKKVKAAPQPSENYLRLAPEPDEVTKKQEPVQKAMPQVARPQVSDTTEKPAASASKTQVAQWYYARNGKKSGPVTAQFLKEKALSGELLPTDQLWKDGLKNWVAAGSLPGLKFPVAQTTTASPVETVPFATADPVVEPNENSIFDIMNDPSFASAPAATAEKPNAGLADMSSGRKKKKAKSGSEEGDGVSGLFIDGIFVLLGLVLAGIFALIALWHYSYMNQLLAEGVTVQGTVVDVRKSYSSSRRARVRHWEYQPTISFTTEDGQHFTFQASYGRTEYAVGDKIEIIYMPSDPNRAAVTGSSSFSLLNLWMIIAIVILIFTARPAFKWLRGQESEVPESWK